MGGEGAGDGYWWVRDCLSLLRYLFGAAWREGKGGSVFGVGSEIGSMGFKA